MIMGQNPQSAFKDVRVRQAMFMAWDRDAYIDVIFNVGKYKDGGLPMETRYSSAFPCDLRGYPGGTYEGYWLDPLGKDFGANAKYYKHDAAEAKKLLAAAGYANGLEFDHLWSLANSFGPGTGRAVDTINATIADAGFKPTVKNLQTPQWLDTVQNTNGNFQGVATAIDSGGPDPANYLFQHYHKDGTRFGGFDPAGTGWSKDGDATLNDNIIKMKTEFDESKRKAIAAELSRYIAENGYNPRYPGGATSLGIQWPVLQNANVWIGRLPAPVGERVDRRHAGAGEEVAADVPGRRWLPNGPSEEEQLCRLKPAASLLRPFAMRRYKCADAPQPPAADIASPETLNATGLQRKATTSGDVLRRHHATDAEAVRLLLHRGVVADAVAGGRRFDTGAGALRYGYTRVYDVDRDAVLAHGGRHGLRHDDHRGVSGRGAEVRGRAGEDAADVDDAAPACRFHVLDGLTGGAEVAERLLDEVVEQQVVRYRLEVVRQRRRRTCRVVDQHLEAAQRVRGAGDEAADRLHIRHVDGNRHDLAPGRGGDFAGGFLQRAACCARR